MNKQFALGLILFLPVLLTSCAKYFSEEEEEEANSKTSTTLHVNPRSGGETELKYPIKIYAFDSEGKCAGQQSIDSSEDEPTIELALAKGTYRIVALAGATEKEYNIPDTPSLTDVIEIKQSNKAEVPLMMGNANVTLKTGTAKATITLNFVVAQLKVTLSNIPTGYSGVDIEMSSSYSKLSFDGNYADGKNNTLASCKRMANGEWDTGTFYTFEGSQKKTVISIHLTKDGVTETYGYTYNNSIKANHPFILSGSYAKSITVEGNIIAGSWAEPIAVDFTFGKNSSEDDKSDNNGNDDNENDSDKENPNETFIVDQIPEEESIWNGCLVLEVNENTKGDEADVLLLGIDNAINDKGKDKIYKAEAAIAVKNYNISDLSNWRIPTKVEAQLLKSRYNGKLSNINEILTDAGGTELVEEKPRYLCNEAHSSFNFKSGTISNAGDQTSYYLRPVKTVHLVKR